MLAPACNKPEAQHAPCHRRDNHESCAATTPGYTAPLEPQADLACTCLQGRLSSSTRHATVELIIKDVNLELTITVLHLDPGPACSICLQAELRSSPHHAGIQPEGSCVAARVPACQAGPLLGALPLRPQPQRMTGSQRPASGKQLLQPQRQLQLQSRSSPARRGPRRSRLGQLSLRLLGSLPPMEWMLSGA